MLAISLQPSDYDVLQGLVHWATVFGLVCLVSLIVSLVASLATYGMRGPARVASRLGQAASDFASLSPRRIYAISMLTFLEAVRRKALLVFVVFAVLFMFGSWFLNTGTGRPELDVEVYVGFVFTAITWLVLPVAILLSCWGLPEDIRLRSLHTVVTKPRAAERDRHRSHFWLRGSQYAHHGDHGRRRSNLDLPAGRGH